MKVLASQSTPPLLYTQIWLALALLAPAGVNCAAIHHNQIHADHFINHINSANSTWTAGGNSDPSSSHNHLTSLMRVNPDEGAHRLPSKQPGSSRQRLFSFQDLPESFDAREKWPECPSIREIADQGSCGSCWAVAAASAMSDRICSHSNGDLQVRVSAQNLLSCCSDCSPGDGCGGGSTSLAWQFWVDEGLVSGSQSESRRGCQPYNINDVYAKCQHTCQNKGYDVPYHRDKTFGQVAYSVWPTAEDIQMEIWEDGPVEANLEVYEDFELYKSGVYQHLTGEFEGYHAVRLLGWGVEKGIPYWLAANSWSDKWGENGTFKILRGDDHCKIETWVDAGLPKV